MNQDQTKSEDASYTRRFLLLEELLVTHFLVARYPSPLL